MRPEAAPIERFLALYEGGTDAEGLWTADAKAKVNMRPMAPLAVVAEVRAIAAAVPDGRLVRMGRLEKDGETAVVWRLQGTHEQPFMDAEPTGEPLVIEGATRFALDATGHRIRRLVCRWSGL